MKVPQEIYDHYWQKGWAVVEGVFQPHEVERIAALALELCQRELDASSTYVTDHSEDGQLAPRKLSQPFLKHPAFQEFALDPRLQERVSSFLGREALLVTDQIFMKPPRFGSAKPYHQDNAYFLCDPGDQVITAWIALDPVDAENGCLRYIDGSHREAILPHEPVPGESHNKVPPAQLIDLRRESLAPVGKGGVVFHHSHCLHTSHRNHSDRWRRGYATHWATAEVTSQSDILEGAYYRREGYPAPCT
jgi:ectoine hydroxylase-related dioxygenase (phytanoyl-CoA dioxygenase family)